MNSGIIVEEIGEESSFFSLNGEWDELVRRSESDFLFLTHDWLACWWKHFGRHGWTDGKMELFVLLARRAGQLCAAAPLVIEKVTVWKVPIRLVRFLGYGVSDYSDFLVGKGSDAGLQAIADYLAARSQAWDILFLEEFHSSSGNLDLFKKCLLKNGFETRTVPASRCHFVRIQGGWESHYRQHFSSDTRRRQRRVWKNLQKEGEIRYTKILSMEEGCPLLEQLAETERRHPLYGPDRKGILNAEIYRDFFREFLPMASSKGWLSVFLLSCDDRIIGYFITFLYGERHYMYATSYDRDFSQYSIGKHLILSLLEDIWTHTQGVVDFLRGKEPFKQNLSDEYRQNFHVISCKRSPSAWIKRWIWNSRYRVRDVRK